MIKQIIRLICPISLLVAMTFILSLPNHTVFKEDPNIIHIKENSLDSQKIEPEKAIPEYNHFEKKDTLIVDRNTNTFHLFTITEEAYVGFEKESAYMAFKGVKEITIDLHSPGGSLYAEKLIETQVAALKERGIKIKTVIGDKNACMSACPLIFLLGDERIASTNSVFMFHAPYIMWPYNTSEPEIVQGEKDLRKSREDYGHVLESVCKNDPTIVMDVLDHDEHYYTATDLLLKCGAGIMTKIEPASISAKPTNTKLILNIPGLNLDDIFKGL